jgi:polyhydroxybutyrate depolymerase
MDFSAEEDSMPSPGPKILASVVAFFALIPPATMIGVRGPAAEDRVPPKGIKDHRVETTGCGKAPPAAPGQSTRITISSGSTKRGCRLHIPKGYGAGRKLPLVIFLHSASGQKSAEEVTAEEERLSGFSDLADQAGFLVAYPEALRHGRGSVLWGTDTPDLPADPDVRFLSDLLDHLQATLCVDERRIYAVGFSSGGGFAGILAHRLSGRLAAFAAVAGYFPLPAREYPAGRPAPILEIHGTADSRVSYDGRQENKLKTQPIGQWLRDRAKRNGCTKGPETFFQKGNVTGSQWVNARGVPMVVHYRVEGGGHDWPGRRGRDDPVAVTPLIWRFFERLSLP